VKTTFEKIVETNRSLRITVLLFEQNANLALEVLHYGTSSRPDETCCTITQARCGLMKK